MAQGTPDTGLDRREFLAAGVTGTLTATAGCLGRIRGMTGWQTPDPIALEIKTVPVDTDPNALRLAQHVAGWLEDAGIDVSVTPMAEEELLREVLLTHEFDVFVQQAPPRFHDPDALYSLLHSTFAAASGWQNPFGYTNLDVDEHLETQREATGAERRRAVERLQRTVARTNPFTVVGFPDDIRAARTDRFTNWRNTALGSPAGYLRLDTAEYDRPTTDDEDDAFEPAELRVVATDARPTENLNPIAVEFRSAGVHTGLVYDSLGYRTGRNDIEPWLAADWELSGGDDGPVARVGLREDVTWHDGNRLTAADVAFTYRFLADTTLDADATADQDPIPAPSYQGRSTLVTAVDVVDNHTVDVEFVECDTAVAARAFTVPILPEHVWADRTETVSLGGIELGAATEALVTDNIPPVGSGPLQFVEREPRERLLLEAFDDHFLTREASDLPEAYRSGPAFDRLSVQVVGSDSAALDLVASGDADVTGTTVGPSVVPRIGRERALDLLVDRSERFYMVGYNARRTPLTNPRFRNALAHLIDKQFITETVFGGYARPAVSPLDGTEWLPSDLEWTDEDPVTPFHGADGALDVEAAREQLRDAGYRYEDGRLVEG